MCQQSPEEGVGSPEAAVIGSCELPGVCSENQTQVLCKDTIHFKPLSYLSSPGKGVCFDSEEFSSAYTGYAVLLLPIILRINLHSPSRWC